ncbi:hypothetical protein AB2M62_12920 [Sphingomonas sp. MMS12-HWE2-04]|uniref:hypothetical protein n=1 Tax=Sphingomonas sp. MMS12-HWE2-04 TaxID=3234199 RepID=UPI00384BFE17
MDLNYLLQRHQVSLIRADAAGSGEARIAHRGLANGYAERIRLLQARLGATFAAPRRV